MSQDIQLDAQESYIGLLSQNSEKKSSEAWSASVRKLQDILEAVAQNDMDTKKGSAPAEGLNVGAINESNWNESPIMKGSLGMAMLFLQQFQISLSEAQANQDQLSTKIGQALVNSAEVSQTNVANEVEKADKERAAAADRPWWEKLIQAVVVVFSVGISALTGGASAAVMAVGLAAFMSSPLFNDAVSGIANAVAAVLVKVYEDEGMSKQDAETKAHAVGNIIGKLVVTIGVVIASMGASGITTAAEGSAEGAAQGAFKLGYSVAKAASAQALKLALVEGSGTLVSSNFWMDVMNTSPEWVANNPLISQILDGFSVVIGMVLTGYAGYKVMQGLEDTTTCLIESLASKAKWLVTASDGAQAGQGLIEFGLGIQRFAYLNEAADTTKMIGYLQALLGEQLAGVDMMSESTSVNDKSAQAITKSVSQQMDTLEQESGRVGSAIARAIHV